VLGSKIGYLENKLKNVATFLAHLSKFWWISENNSGNTDTYLKLCDNFEVIHTTQALH
jgi:hypothetical protein